MAELLVELFSEEIPARMQARAAADLKWLVCDGVKAAGLTFDGAEAYATPRRLALVIDGVPAAQPDVREEKRGPKVDAPEKAIAGFLKGNGLTRAQCEVRETDKGTFLFAVIERKGRPTADVLAELLPQTFADLPWPKSMRWGSGPVRWVRPLHSIIALFDGAVVPFSFADVPAGDRTRGHRFHAPDALTVTGFRDYKEKLKAARVVLDPAERKREIVAQADALARAEGLSVADDPALVDEIAGLVEWPVSVMGRFDARFMDVPREVLVTTMRVNQKYLALNDKDGELAPRFITFANLEAEDGGRQIAAGNEYVLTARLSDAEFFWTQDKKASLESRLPKLADMVFHQKLGSLGDKVTRITDLAGELAQYVSKADTAQAKRAAKLAKADLVSDMVYEFPELQGVMGRYYALNDGEPPIVAEAIAQHYAPAGPSDDCPTDPVAVCAALADKLDTLVGFWSIGEKPTGSRDPFALRRAALGVIRLVLENGLRLPLLVAFRQAKQRVDPHADYGDEAPKNVENDLLVFFADRLKAHLREQGVRHDLISAVFALGDEDDLVRLIARVEALRDFLDSEDGANLLTAYRRAANILRIEEKKDGVSYDQPVDAGAFAQNEETALNTALVDAQARIAAALKDEDYAAAMAAMAALRAPVDGFFDHVTVNADDAGLRANRLRLLSQIRMTLHQVADFSQIEG